MAHLNHGHGLFAPPPDFNVDPNQPFLGGGVNPSSYEPSGPANPMPPRPMLQQVRTMGTNLRRYMSQNRGQKDVMEADEESSSYSEAPSPDPRSAYPVPASQRPDPYPGSTNPFPSIGVAAQRLSEHSAGSSTSYSYASPGSAHSQTLHGSDEVPDGETTVVNHEIPAQVLQPNAVYSPVLAHPQYAPDYAKMDTQPLEQARTSVVERFFKYMSDLPWVAKDRVTVDYIPSRRRHQIDPSQPRPKSLSQPWYNDPVGDIVYVQGEQPVTMIANPAAPTSYYIPAPPPAAPVATSPNQMQYSDGFYGVQPAGDAYGNNNYWNPRRTSEMSESETYSPSRIPTTVNYGANTYYPRAAGPYPYPVPP